MKGMTALVCISDIDLDIIEESMVLFDSSKTVARAKGKELSGLSRFLNSGWGVAMICAVVSLTVLIAIIWAGQRPIVTPPTPGTPESDTVGPEIPSEPVTEAETIPPSENLAFRSNGDGTCRLTGMGKCRDTNVVVPAYSPDGDRVTEIAEGAFRSNNRLVSMILPSGITAIPAECFYYCKSLEAVSLSARVEVIGARAFEGCSALTEMELPSGLRRIEEHAFRSCTALTGLELPEGLTFIGREAFRKCEGLSSMTVPKSVSEIGEAAFLSCNGLVSVTLSDGIKSMGHSVFMECTALKEIVWPMGMDEVPLWTFMSCSSLTRVTFSRDVSVICGAAFENCVALESLVIPSGLLQIDSRAFYGCGALKDIYYEGSASQWRRVVIDKDGNQAVISATLHENYMGEGQNTPHPDVAEGGVLFISNGDGTCKIKGSDKTCQGSITVPEKSPYGDTVTTVATGAFKSFRFLTSVTLPDTVTVIGDSAFQGCGSLVSVTLPPAVTEFGRAMFDGCRALQSVMLPEGLTEIPAMTFQTCVNLQSVVAQEGVTHIGANAFNGCSSLAELTLPAGLKSIGSAAFMNCCGLRTVYYGGDDTEWRAVSVHEYENSHLEHARMIFARE